jgi:hypothetical protein
MIALELSSPPWNRSQTTIPPECAFSPYTTVVAPESAVRSAPAKGMRAAMASVSTVRVMRRASVPSGRVERHPSQGR